MGSNSVLVCMHATYWLHFKILIVP